MAIVFTVYWLTPHKYRWIIILAANVWFYTCYDVKYLAAILITMIASFICAILMDKKQGAKKNKVIMLTGVITSLSLLLVFKYLNFALYTVSKILNRISIPMQETTLKLIMPVGISFYTFMAVGYIIDVYKGKTEPVRHFGKYAIFLSFFPNISSGPIERAGHFIPQIDKEKSFDYDSVVYGARLLMLGMIKKIVIADMMVKYVDEVFNKVPEHRGICFAFATLLYTFEIYCDFSGYSDMAIGVARMLGFELIGNFRQPYLASSIKEFWGRWHISLSTWFRDYVYIPLGGSRRGKIRSYVNLIITFTLSGLWHGAAFKYIAWGLFHGIAQCAEKIFKLNTRKNDEVKSPVKIALRRVGVFLTAAALWCFFRANSLKQALYFFANMFKGALHPVNYVLTGLSFFDTRLLCFMILPLILLFIFDKRALKSDPLKDITGLKAGVRWIIYVLFFLLFMLLASFNSKEFVYFKF